MKSRVIKIVSIVAAIVSVLTVGVIGISHTVPPTPKELFEKSIQSIAELKAISETVGESYGTAVCINAEGHLITNAHVVTYKQMGGTIVYDAFYIRLANEDEYHAVELVKYDLKKDIAVLKNKDSAINLTPIKIGNSDKLSYGDKVYAIGNGSNYGLAITHGIISTPKINIEYEDVVREVIQSDITISAGNSGGALLDNKGNLIGITSFRTKDSQGNVVYGLVYSVPVNIIIDYIDQ